MCKPDRRKIEGVPFVICKDGVRGSCISTAFCEACLASIEGHGSTSETADAEVNARCAEHVHEVHPSLHRGAA